MKKILVFGMSDNYGGIESVIMNYYRKFDKTKIHFDFVCYQNECVCEDEIYNNGGVVFKFSGKNIGLKHRKFLKHLMSNYDGIWCNRCDLANIDILKIAKRAKIKTRIIHSHNTDIMDKNVFKRVVKRIFHLINKRVIFKYATNYFACSDAAGRWFYSNKIMSSDKYLVVNNAIDLKKFAYSAEQRLAVKKELNLEGCFVVGNVGRLQRQKNQTFLLDVFYEISKKQPNARLLLVGKGEDENLLRQKAINLGIDKVVFFLGMRNDVPQILQAIDIFVFPSIFEGLPLTLIEAQASGTYVLCSSTISEEVKCTDLLNFVSLDQNPKHWAELALNCVLKKRKYEEVCQEVRAAGFDIEFEARKLEGVFLD